MKNVEMTMNLVSEKGSAMTCIERTVLAMAVELASVALGKATTVNPLELETFDLDGRKIRYLDVGEGKAVMLLHGFACDHTDWRHQIRALAERYRVITPDLAFFGQSDPGKRPHTTINHAEDCRALLDHLRIPKAVVVGHSMGGWIARGLYLQTPRHVEAIVEIDNTAIAPALDQLPKLLGVHRPSGKQHSSVINDKRRKQYVADKAEMTRRFGGRSAKPAHKPSPTGKWCRVPVLVIWTSRGAVAQDDIPNGWVRENFPSNHARLVVVRDSGHWAMLEQPGLVNKAILDFLQELP
jgi:pimeloyl-ACP methyl ester carboxylesterase